jgi:hypothetical protein
LKNCNSGSKNRKNGSEGRNDQRHLRSAIAIGEDETDPRADEGYFESYDLRADFLTLNNLFAQFNKKVLDIIFPIPCRFAHIDGILLLTNSASRE